MVKKFNLSIWVPLTYTGEMKDVERIERKLNVILPKLVTFLGNKAPDFCHFDFICQLLNPDMGSSLIKESNDLRYLRNDAVEHCNDWNGHYVFVTDEYLELLQTLCDSIYSDNSHWEVGKHQIPRTKTPEPINEDHSKVQISVNQQRRQSLEGQLKKIQQKLNLLKDETPEQ